MAAFAPMVAPTLTDGARAGIATYTCALDRLTHEGAHPAGSAREAEYERGGLCETFS